MEVSHSRSFPLDAEARRAAQTAQELIALRSRELEEARARLEQAHDLLGRLVQSEAHRLGLDVSHPIRFDQQKGEVSGVCK